MKFTVLTLFPELFELYLSQTIIQRAVDAEIIDYDIVNIRDYSGNKHGQMDDVPFGGGAGDGSETGSLLEFFLRKDTVKVKNLTRYLFLHREKRLDHRKVTELVKKKRNSCNFWKI